MASERCILVSGATGFVGRAVVHQLARDGGVGIRAAHRHRPVGWPEPVSDYPGLDLGSTSGWDNAVAGVSCVIHCAARVHVLAERAADPPVAFRAVNTTGTLALAEAAARAGVRRFVFLSTIGVNGAQTHSTPFTANDAARPHSPYAQSKYEAECGLLALAASSGMEIVILRPPLVYGPNAPGNFATLLRWLERGVPLPLGAIKNKRSFVYLGNLVDLIIRCTVDPRAANRTFLVSDGEDISTTELLRRMGRAAGVQARLVPVPESILRIAMSLAGRRKLAQQLLGSLQVDIEFTRRTLEWTPRWSVDQALAATVASARCEES